MGLLAMGIQARLGMSQGDSTAEIGAAPRRIQQTLRSDVAELLKYQFIPFHTLEVEQVYDEVLNNPANLDACFRLLREKPQLFCRLVVDDKGEPVYDDAHPLACGRTLAEVVTMVVRASAKRYFRAKLGGPRKVTLKPPARPLTQRVTDVLGLTQAPPAKTRRLPGAGDRMFAAIRDYLQFDWQAGLIPAYAPLGPDLAAQLGPRLFNIREACELRALASRDERQAATTGGAPLVLDTAHRLIRASGDTIDGEILWRVCQQMDLARLFPGQDNTLMRKAIAQVAATSPGVIAQLMPVLGADIRYFVCFLMIGFVILGETDYRLTLGMVADAHGGTFREIMERLLQEQLPPPKLDDMRAAFIRVIAPHRAAALAGNDWQKALAMPA